MPVVGMAMGGADFSQLFVALNGEDYANLAAAQAAAAPVVTYGAFIQTLIDFLLIAFVIFLIIKAYNRMSKPEEAAPAAPAEEVLLLREIRDSLKKCLRPPAPRRHDRRHDLCPTSRSREPLRLAASSFRSEKRRLGQNVVCTCLFR